MHDYLLVKYVIVIVGLVGNLIEITVFARKKNKKFPSRVYFIVLSIADLTCLFYYIVRDSIENFSQNWNIASSNLLCKLNIILLYALSTNSNWLLGIISLDKYFSIRWPSVKILKKKWFQIVLLLAIILHNFILYSPLLFYSGLVFNNQTNNTKCDLFNTEIETFNLAIDTINCFLPLIMKLLFSILLIHTIMKSRLRILRITTQFERNKLKKDIRFAISTLFLNLFGILLYFPINLVLIAKLIYFLDFDNIFICLLYIAYAANFYILFLTNKIIRKQTILLFKLK